MLPIGSTPTRSRVELLITCVVCSWRVPQRVAHSDGERCVMCVLQAARRTLGVSEERLLADEQRWWRVYARYQK